MTFAREPLTVVELVQPLCAQTFGVSPCDAAGEPCFNTDATCRFREALDMSGEIRLRFVEPLAHGWIDGATAFQPALAIPLLRSWRVAPTELNVASGNRDKSHLGYRGILHVVLRDAPSNDSETDPYVGGRGYDPIERGSFWSKWLSRNPFHVGYEINVYEGERGDALADMTKRQYFVEKIDAGRDGVTITAKDVLRRVTDTGVTAPALSPGELALDISETATSFAVAGATLNDYPESGLLRIGSEILSYTSRSGFGNITFTGVLRGLLNTQPSQHRQQERVQRVLAYEGVRFDDILRDLFFNWGGIDPSFEDADWTAEADEWRPEFIFTSYIAEPVKVEELAAEVCLQTLVNVWWDERVQRIKLRPQRPDVDPPTITEDADIIAGSLAITEKPEDRASQVHVYYLPRDWTGSVTDRFNYERAAVFIDALSQVQHGGEPQIRELFCRFITTDAIANNLAATYLNRFRNVRRQVRFQLADERTYWTGDSLKIRHYLDVDAFGERRDSLWMITAAETDEPGIRYSFTAEDNEMVGVLWEWVGEGPDFADATTEEQETVGFWLTDDDTDIDGNPRPFRWL